MVIHLPILKLLLIQKKKKCMMTEMSKEVKWSSLIQFSFYFNVFVFICKVKKETVNDPFRSLFLYAALNNMADMAVHLWRYGKNSLMKALAGKLVFQKMYFLIQQKPVSEKPGVNSDMKRELRESER